MIIQSTASTVRQPARELVQPATDKKDESSVPASFSRSSKDDVLFSAAFLLPTAVVGGVVGYAKGGTAGAISGAVASSVLTWPAGAVGTLAGGTLTNRMTGDADCALKVGLATGVASGISAMVGGGYLAALATNQFLA